MQKIFTQQYMANTLSINIAYMNQILTGRQHASWSLAKKISKLTNSDPIIWADKTPDAARKRRLAVLREELRQQEAQVV